MNPNPNPDPEKSAKKKRKIKSKLDTTAKKLNADEAVQSIDDLFQSVKKLKQISNTHSSSATKGTKLSSVQKKEKRVQKKADFEDDDGGMEYFDDNDETVEEESRSYGIIKSRYNPSQILNPEAPLERIDPESGLPVYKAHLLKVGDGGGTALCPFDCACCF